MTVLITVFFTVFIIFFIFIFAMGIWMFTRALSQKGRGGRRGYGGSGWTDQSTGPHLFSPHTDVHYQRHHHSHMTFGHTGGTSYADSPAGGYTADSNVHTAVSGGDYGGSWDSSGGGGSDFGGFGGGSDFDGGGSGGDFGGGDSGGGGDVGGGGDS